jgi:hypothetical protein
LISSAKGNKALIETLNSEMNAVLVAKEKEKSDNIEKINTEYSKFYEEISNKEVSITKEKIDKEVDIVMAEYDTLKNANSQKVNDLKNKQNADTANASFIDILFGLGGTNDNKNQDALVDAQMEELTANIQAANDAKAKLRQEDFDNAVSFAEAQKKLDQEIADNQIRLNELQAKRQTQNAESYLTKFNESATAISDIFSAVISNNEAESAQTQKRLKEELKAGKITQEKYDKEIQDAQEKTNEKNKKWEAGIAMIQGIVGSVAAMTQSIKSYGVPYGLIIGAATSASIIASTVASIKKIYAQTVSDSSSTNSSSTATEATTSPMVYSTTLTSSSQQQEINRNSQNTKVYVLESDITKAQNTKRTVVANSTF